MLTNHDVGRGAMLGFSTSAKNLSYALGTSLRFLVEPSHFMFFISLALHKEVDRGERIYLSFQFQVRVYHYNCRKVKMAWLWDSWFHHIHSQEQRKNDHMHVPLLFLMLISTSLLIRVRTICLGNDATHGGLSLLTSISLSHSSIDMPQTHQID